MITNVPNQAYYLNLEDSRSAKLSPDNSQVYVLHNKGIQSINLTTGGKFDFPTFSDGSDFVFLPDGRLLVATARGLVIYTGAIASLIPSTKVGGRLKVRENLIFQHIGTSIYVYDLTFKNIAQKTVGVTVLNDFEFKNNMLYVCGYQQSKFDNIPVQIAFVYRYKFENNVFMNIPIDSTRNQGKLWGYGADQLTNNSADTRGEKLSIEGDRLYFLGSAFGGNNIFRYNGVDLSTNTLSSIDNNSSPALIPSDTSTYIGVIDIASFTVVKGQLVFTRLGNGRGNTIFPRTIHADVNSLFVAGRGSYQIPDRPTRTFANKPLPAYTGMDTSFKQYDKQLTSRQWVTPGRGDPILFNDKVAVMRVSIRDLAQTKPVTLQASDNNSYLIVW